MKGAYRWEQCRECLRSDGNEFEESSAKEF